MKNKLHLLILGAGIFIGSLEKVQGQTTLIHYWDFNNANVPVAGSGWDGTAANYPTQTYSGYAADYNKSGSAKLLYRPYPGTVTNYSASALDNYVATDVDTLNRRQGFGNCCTTPNYSVRARNPSDSMELVMFIPTTHYKNITIKYECEPSSLTSGQSVQLYSYSTDSAQTWQTTGLSQTFDSASAKAWKLISLNFGTQTSVNDNRKLAFRIRFRTHITGTSGNTRYDNITVEGDSIVSGSTVGLATYSSDAAKYMLYPNPAKEQLIISSANNGPKAISVINVTGQTVFVTEQTGTLQSLNVGELAKGLYYVNIREIETNEFHVLKFVKE